MPGVRFGRCDAGSGLWHPRRPGAWRLAGLAAACLSLTLLGGCQYTAEGSKLGLYRSGSGQVTLYVLLCPGQYVNDVELDGGNPESSAPPVLWKIHASHRTGAWRFTIGSAPAGYVTVTPFTSQIGAGEYRVIWAFIVGTAGGFAEEFTGNDLRPGRVYVQGPGLLGSGAYVTLAKFESIRERSCQLIQGPGG